MKTAQLPTTDGMDSAWTDRVDLVTNDLGGAKIRRHSALVAKARLPLAGAWIALRFLLIPVLWLPLKLGSRMTWAFAVDSFMKRQLYPLTERPDDAWVQATGPLPTRSLPLAAVTCGRERLELSRLAQGRPLLLVLYRGSWCPYSRLHLTDLSRVTRELAEVGVATLAVSAHNNEEWWRTHGVDLTFAADPDGELFRALGVQIEPPLAHRAWGMLLPHESVFLFDARGELIAADVRRLSSTKTEQTFLTSNSWLARAREHIAANAKRAG